MNRTHQGLKADMAETAQSAAEVERALQQLQHRHLPFPASQGCALCAAPAMASQFYLFPCRSVISPQKHHSIDV